MVSSTCLKGKLIVYIKRIKDMNIYSEVKVCGGDIWQPENMELRVVILW